MPSSSAIRTLFLHPHPTYLLAEAAALLGMTVEELAGWMEVGEVEGVEREDGVTVVPWSEVVSFGMDFWSQEVVEAALGAEVAMAIPELVRLRELEVRIPALEVVALERVAARDGRTVDAVVARELRDFVSAHSEWLAREVPGFGEALGWPEEAV